MVGIAVMAAGIGLLFLGPTSERSADRRENSRRLLAANNRAKPLQLLACRGVPLPHFSDRVGDEVVNQVLTDAWDRIGAVGKPHLLCSVRIVDEAGLIPPAARQRRHPRLHPCKCLRLYPSPRPYPCRSPHPCPYAFRRPRRPLGRTPWPPLHVDRGFSREENVVTVVNTEAPHSMTENIQTVSTR